MIRCALCGFEYEPVPSCPAACPLSGACHFVCCPRCGYQNIDPSQASSVKLATDVGNAISSAMKKIAVRFETRRGGNSK